MPVRPSQSVGSLADHLAEPTITLTPRVRAAAYPTVTNTATTVSSDPDPPGPASDSDGFMVEPEDNLTLPKHHEGTFVVGQQGTYLLTVANPGPTPTPGPIIFTDRLPDRLTYVSRPPVQAGPAPRPGRR